MNKQTNKYNTIKRYGIKVGLLFGILLCYLGVGHVYLFMCQNTLMCYILLLRYSLHISLLVY